MRTAIQKSTTFSSRYESTRLICISIFSVITIKYEWKESQVCVQNACLVCDNCRHEYERTGRQDIIRFGLKYMPFILFDEYYCNCLSNAILCDNRWHWLAFGGIHSRYHCTGSLIPKTLKKVANYRHWKRSSQQIFKIFAGNSPDKVPFAYLN